MRVGLHLPNFTWPGGPAALRERLAEVARTADEAGFSFITVMDHFFQIGVQGPVELEMLEGYSALSFLAGVTKRVRLGTMVTGVTYRHPGVLVKTVTTLDVLSGGRAFLGVGAAWFEREHVGLGVPFPPLKERFERLEETLPALRAAGYDDRQQRRRAPGAWAKELFRDRAPIGGVQVHLGKPLVSRKQE